MDSMSQLRKDIISAARILSHQRLVQGFGHVSARIPDSDLFLITPRIMAFHDFSREIHREQLIFRHYRDRKSVV